MDKKSERARVLKERNALSSAKYAELNRALCGFVSRFLESAEAVSYTHLTLPTIA